MKALVRVLRAGGAFAFVGGVFALGWVTCWLSGAVGSKTERSVVDRG